MPIILLVPCVVTAVVAPTDAEAGVASSSGDISSSVVAQPNGAPSLFIQANGTIFNNWDANGTWLSSRMAFYTTSPPANASTLGFASSRAVAVLQPDGAPSIFFQGTGGSLWNYWYVNGTWDSAEIVPNGVASAPVAILQPNGSPSVFVVGPNKSLLNYWYIPGQGSWGSGTVAGGGSVFQVPAAAADPGSGAPDVFVEGPNHELVEYSYWSGTWSHSPIAAFGGAATAFSAPGVVVQPGGPISIFVVGPHASLLNYWFPPSCIPSSSTICTAELQVCPTPCWGSATVAQQGSAFSTPEVISQSNGAPTTFVLGPNGSVLNYWYIPSQGTWSSGTVEPPGSETSQVFGALAQTDGSPEVFFAHEDGSLWAASYSQGGWTNSNFAVNDVPVDTYTDP